MTDRPTPAKNRKSRSDYRRGPAKAGQETAATGRKKKVPYGGYGLQDAERHMSGIAPDSGIDHGDEAQFALTRAIVVAGRRWRRIANDRIRHLDQNMARLEILYLVAYSGEDLNQSQLAQLVSVKGSTMVHMLDALAREGLIERHQSTIDRRVTVNRITMLGRDKMRAMMQDLSQLRNEVYDGIDPHKLKETLAVMGEILAKLEALQ